MIVSPRVLTGLLPALLVTVVSARAAGGNLLEARAGFQTTLTEPVRDAEPLGAPPAALFSLVQYPTPLGDMAAYLGVRPDGDGRHPAILWITGGFPPGGIGSSAWTAQPLGNDQSAKAYRQAGLVMLYPSFRGSFGNPGSQESLMGEVDDVISALAYLKGVDYVDPARIYLGGHSTGGTLALLVAASTDEFKAVIAFGPVDETAVYGAGPLNFNPRSAKESALRAPIRHLAAITSPTFVIEGDDGGNADSLRRMRDASRNPLIRFFELPGLDHFDVLAPSNRLIAARLAGLGAEEALSFEVKDLMGSRETMQDTEREVWDLDELSYSRTDEVSFSEPVPVRHFLSTYSKKTALHSAAAAAAVRGFKPRPTVERKDSDGDPYFLVVAVKTYRLGDLDGVFAASKTMQDLADKYGLDYDGWSAR